MAISQKILNVIANSSVEKLEFQNIRLNQDVKSSIGKMKTLKSLSTIGKFDFNVVSFLIELGNNSEQLEAIELSESFHAHGIGTFLKARCNTLKKLKLKGVFYYQNDPVDQELSLCQKLREISMNNCPRFPFNSENFYLMPELFKVYLHDTEVTKNIYGKFFRQGAKLANLKYLCLKGCFQSLIEYEQFLAELATQDCPNLETISIDIITITGRYYGQSSMVDVTESSLKQLFQNCPKLKILKLVGFGTSELSRAFLFEVYQTRNIFLDIWKNRSKDLAEFEQYVTNQADEFCAKYFKIKLNMSNYWICDNDKY